MKNVLHECFSSFQGEGVHMGRAAFFVRLMGCDQKCHFCDSAGTWHPSYKPANALRLTAQEIVAQMQASTRKGAFMVLTGGEPSLHPLDELIECAHQSQITVHIETAGHRPLPTRLDWITLSPKPFATLPLRQNIQIADEFKIIVEDENSLKDGLDCVLAECRDDAQIWLHPEWSRRADRRVLDLISQSVKENPRLRAGFQLHKCYRSDWLDPDALKTVVPLGGNVEKGLSQ